MGVTSWLWGRPGVSEGHAKGDESLVSVVSPWRTNQPLPDNHDYESLCQDGYERNPVIWACVNAIASSVAEPDLKVMKSTKDGPQSVRDHDLVTLLDRPNEDEDQFEFLYRLLAYYCIAGEACIHKVRSGSGRIVQLQLLRPDRIEPVVDVKGKVRHYEYRIDGALQEKIPPQNILMMRRLHPRDDFRGLSPITVAARFADLDNQGADFLRSVLNNGIVRGILTLKQKTSPEQRRDVQEQWAERYSSPSGWNKVAVLDEETSYQTIGLNPEDSDLGAIFGETESRMCMAFGVPPIVIAAKIGMDRSTYSNYEQAMRSFWQQTLSPLFVQVAARLTHGIAREFDPSLYLGWDFSGVAALRENEDAVATRANAGWMAGTLTRNEARTAMGLPRLEGGDVYRSDLSAMLEPAVAESQATARMARIDELIERMAAEVPG